MSQPLTFPFKFRVAGASDVTFTAQPPSGDLVCITWSEADGEHSTDYHTSTVEMYVRTGTWARVTE